MERKFGYFILMGLVTGALLGLAVGATSGNLMWAIGLGSLAGLFIGWFAAAAAQDNENRKKLSH
ncbi:MAG: hypothetical protein Kow0031_41170 [Anaerolineae bacterium]